MALAHLQHAAAPAAGLRASHPTRRGLALAQNVGVALGSLLVNKLRSALTMLGITIGVGAVILMVGLGQGAQARMQSQLAGLGTNLLVIMSGSAREGPVQGGAGTQQTLTEADAQAVRDQIPGLTGISPVIGGGGQVVANNQNWSTRWLGVEPTYLAMQNYQVQSGTAFTDDDDSSRASVALIGQTVATNLFGTQDPVGQTIRLRNVTLTVQGLLASKGSNGFQDQDDIILLPFSTARVRLNNVTYVQSIDVQVADASQMTSAQDAITQLLRERHRLAAQASDDFNVRNNNQIQQTVNSALGTVTLLLASVAGVSLVVGGIGIMNIMLVSVRERTREIGIRMAVGARRSVILTQFLVEAITLSLVGGIAGMLLGIGGGTLLGRAAGWATQVSVSSILLAFGFSAAVGIIFGFYPARSASHLDPIVALRAE